jgi:hypothetical protein
MPNQGVEFIYNLLNALAAIFNHRCLFDRLLESKSAQCGRYKLQQKDRQNRREINTA